MITEDLFSTRLPSIIHDDKFDSNSSVLPVAEPDVLCPIGFFVAKCRSDTVIATLKVTLRNSTPTFSLSLDYPLCAIDEPLTKVMKILLLLKKLPRKYQTGTIVNLPHTGSRRNS